MVDEMRHRTLYDIWYRMPPRYDEEIVETGLPEEEKDRLMRAILAAGGTSGGVWRCEVLKEPEVRLPIGKPDEIDPTSDDDNDERKMLGLRPVSVPVEPPCHVYLLMTLRYNPGKPSHRLFGPFRTTTEATDWGSRSKWGFGGDWSHRVIYLEPPEGLT